MNYSEMSSKNLLATLNDIDEQNTLEAKSLRDDSSRSILETVCSFSNEPGLGGGVILIGIAETKAPDGPSYFVDGVDDPDKAQLDLATQCKSVFNSAVYPTIKVEKIGRKKVLKVVIDELPASRKPLYFKSEGLPKGAFRRVGSADLVATDDDLGEFYRLAEGNFEATPVKYATIADVDPEAVEKYREMRREVDSTAVELKYGTQKLLAALGCVNPDNPKQLNVAGLVMFGKANAIRRLCPRARVDYVRIPSNEWNAKERLAGKDTYAPIFLMVDKLLSIVYSELTVDRRFSPDKPHPDIRTFPIEVMREAIVNALMHTDYSRGQYTQIVRYNNRIEITNSGCSLKPDEALGTLGSVPRNQTIANACHDTKLAEAKGSGIDRMWQIMADAGFSRPTMESDRLAGTFTIRLLLHPFMDEDTLLWLKRFAGYELNDNQRTAIVFLREVGALDALAYRQLTGCPTKRVARDLAGLKAQGLMIQKGRARGAYYVPSEMLLMSTPRPVMSTPQAVMSTPRPVMSTPRPVMSTPQAKSAPARGESAPAHGDNAPASSANTTPLPANTTPRSANTTPQPTNTTPLSATGTPPPITGTPPSITGTPQAVMRTLLLDDLPEALQKRIARLKRRVPCKVMESLIVEICSLRPMGRMELANILNRSVVTVDRIVTPLVGKRLDYLYPMMIHHPNQAYVARVGVESGSEEIS